MNTLSEPCKNGRTSGGAVRGAGSLRAQGTMLKPPNGKRRFWGGDIIWACASMPVVDIYHILDVIHKESAVMRLSLPLLQQLLVVTTTLCPN